MPETIIDEGIEVQENINASGCRILIKNILSKKDAEIDYWKNIYKKAEELYNRKDAEIKELKKQIELDRRQHRTNENGIAYRKDNIIKELKLKLEEKEKEIDKIYYDFALLLKRK